jgi:regulatory protein
MPIITGVVPAEGRPGYVVILVDGAPFATVPAESAATFTLGSAARIPPGEAAPRLEAAPLGEAAQKTYGRALSLLSFRARSASELEKRLIEKGEPREQVAVVIARLAASGLLDDARYAESRARTSIVGKSRSRRRIQQDLAQRGVARDVADAAIRQVMAEEGTDEASVAERAARKKMRSLGKLDPAEQRQKLYGFLARQGYASDVVRKAMRAVLDAPLPDEDEGA